MAGSAANSHLQTSPTSEIEAQGAEDNFRTYLLLGEVSIIS